MDYTPGGLASPLCTPHGNIDPGPPAAILAAFRLGRSLERAEEPETIRTPDDLGRVALRELSGLRRERVVVIVLDAGNRARRVIRLTEGTVDRAPNA